jgi:threonine synthase
MVSKDVGAFYVALFGLFQQRQKDSKNVLVAASGDTGGAVAVVLGVAGVEVIILYPSGKVSDIQEKQLTTLGQNIKALEVGCFDDCQDMVKSFLR